MSSPRFGLFVLLVLLAIPTVTGQPRAAADGDPGSDVLLAQNLYVGNDGFSVKQELALGRLLDATASDGAPVRVAIIGQPADLGSVGGVWRQPRRYAGFLDYELSGVYTGRLLIVMPNGYGVAWSAHPREVATLEHTLSGLPTPGASTGGLIDGARSAVLRLERQAGIAASKLRAATGVGSTMWPTPHQPGAARDLSPHHHFPTGILATALLLITVCYVAIRRGWRSRRPATGWWSRATAGLKGVRIGPAALLPAFLLVIVLGALALNQGAHPGESQASYLANNPGLDQGTPLKPKLAPNFTLYDESGQQVSLRQYRGRVVILSFVDAECQTICPLTTQAMLDAKADLGAAGTDVQLLGVNANWRSTQIDDVANYTQMHGLSGQWHFLTNPSRGALERVWSAYGVDEKKFVRQNRGQIDHVASTFVIDPQGRLRETYMTYSNYGAIPQFGQLMATEASSLLPSHPTVHSNLSYQAIKGIPPTQTATVPRVGGGNLTLGPGRAHLYVFFDTWDRQTSRIGPELDELNTYQADAKRLGLPPVIAIDEGAVEPNSSALPSFLKTLPHALRYPIGIDQTGNVADGYGVQGEPWLVLVAPSGKLLWYQEGYTQGWPSLSDLELQVRASLQPLDTQPKESMLVGSPAPLARLHAQASRLLNGADPAFEARLKSLRGYPVVVGVWASWCPPCRAEFGYFQTASVLYGKRIAFVGYDYRDPTNAQAFLNAHHVAYPSYASDDNTIGGLLPAGIDGPPATFFLDSRGKVVGYQSGKYESLGALEADIEQYALAAR